MLSLFYHLVRQRYDEIAQKRAPRYLRATFVRRGRDLAEKFELYQIVLNRVDLEAIAIPVYANLREYVLNCFKWYCQ